MPRYYFFDEFVIKHLPREENEQANALAQQASDYNVEKKNFGIRKPMRIKAKLQVLDEPVRPIMTTGLTAQTGVTGPDLPCSCPASCLQSQSGE